jgi:PAS domain-containing protein
MNRRALVLEGSLCALAAVVLVLLNGWSLRRTFERQKRHALERLQKPAVLLIERSWHLKDDLAIQQVVTALGQAPGIYFACVIGPDGKVMAHSQPANVGQIYHRSDTPIAAHSLAEGQKKWGTLVISASEKSQWCAWRHEVASGSLAGLVLWLAWMVRSLHWRRSLAEQEHRISDLLTLAEEEKQKVFRETERQSRAGALWTAWLQSVMELLPEGMVILDQRQRVVAVNAPAVRLLNAGGQAMLSGAPWSETPLLRSCGAALEQSLCAPGAEVKVDLPEDGVRLALMTLKGGLGTRVTLLPFKPCAKNEKVGQDAPAIPGGKQSNVISETIL